MSKTAGDVEAEQFCERLFTRVLADLRARDRKVKERQVALAAVKEEHDRILLRDLRCDLPEKALETLSPIRPRNLDEVFALRERRPKDAAAMAAWGKENMVFSDGGALEAPAPVAVSKADFDRVKEFANAKAGWHMRHAGQSLQARLIELISRGDVVVVEDQ